MSQKRPRDCRPKDPEPDDTSMVTFLSALVRVSNSRKWKNWMSDSGTRDIANGPSYYFTDFVACKGVIQANNKKLTSSLGHGTVRVTTNVARL